MKASLFFSILILVILHISSANSLLKETCRKVSNDEKQYQFCVTSLQVDPGSQNADTRGLAEITIKLDKANFTQTWTKINALLANKALPHGARVALNDCRELYSVGLDILKKATNSIRLGDLPSLKTFLSAVQTDIDTCKEGFTEQNLASLLTKENDDAWNLSGIALSIVVMLL